MEVVPLTANHWPDFTDLFDLNPESEPWFNFGQGQGANTPGLNYQQFQRPSLTLNNEGLTHTQSQLLSRDDQEIQKKLNEQRT